MQASNEADVSRLLVSSQECGYVRPLMIAVSQGAAVALLSLRVIEGKGLDVSK